jgi:hypothetical protein
MPTIQKWKVITRRMAMPRIPSRTGIRSPEGAGLVDPAAAAACGKPEEIDKTESDILNKSQM